VAVFVQTKHENVNEIVGLLGFSLSTILTVYRNWCERHQIFSEWQFCGCKHLVGEKCQRRMARLVQADRKVNVTEKKTMCYNTSVSLQLKRGN